MLLFSFQAVTSDVTAFEHEASDWLRALLPVHYLWIGSKHMLTEDELAAWLQDAPHAQNRLYLIRNCAKREGANNCIDVAILQRDAFSRQV